MLNIAAICAIPINRDAFPAWPFHIKTVIRVQIKAAAGRALQNPTTSQESSVSLQKTSLTDSSTQTKSYQLAIERMKAICCNWAARWFTVTAAVESSWAQMDVSFKTSKNRGNVATKLMMQQLLNSTEAPVRCSLPFICVYGAISCKYIQECQHCFVSHHSLQQLVESAGWGSWQRIWTPQCYWAPVSIGGKQKTKIIIKRHNYGICTRSSPIVTMIGTDSWQLCKHANICAWELNKLDFSVQSLSVLL